MYKSIYTEFILFLSVEISTGRGSSRGISESELILLAKTGFDPMALAVTASAAGHPGQHAIQPQRVGLSTGAPPTPPHMQSLAARFRGHARLANVGRNASPSGWDITIIFGRYVMLL